MPSSRRPHDAPRLDLSLARAGPLVALAPYYPPSYALVSGGKDSLSTAMVLANANAAMSFARDIGELIGEYT